MSEELENKITDTQEVVSAEQTNTPQKQEAEPKRKKGLSSGLQRLLTGLALLAVMLFFLLYLRKLCVHAFDVIGMFFVVMGGLEMHKALKSGGHNVMLAPLIVFFVTVYPLFFVLQWLNTTRGVPTNGTEGIMIATALAACTALGIFTFRHTHTLTDLGLTILNIIYPCVFVAMIMAINLYAGNLLAILLLLAVPLLSDAAAYYVGSKFGKRKLCPTISPKKSVEGLYGGVVGALIAGAAVMLLFDVFRVMDPIDPNGLHALSDKWWLRVLLYAVLSVLVMIAGMVGDLVASWVKRQVGIKDYGKIFPGHGGVMDRMDSVIFAMPVVYLFFTIYNAVVHATV